jgi:hypothetical protein
MPKNHNDQLNKHNSPLDTIESVGKAALAIGAGAALLYKNGGSQVLSSGIKRASYALNETLNTASKTALKDMDADFVSDIVSGFKKAFSEADDKATLRNGPESILNAVSRVYQMTKDKSGYLYKMYDDEKILYPLKLDFQQRFGNGDSELLRRAENVVDDFVKHIDDVVSYDNGSYQINPEFIEKHFGEGTFSEEQQKTMLQELKAAMGRKDVEAKQYVEENASLIDEFVSQFNNIDNLAKQYGIRGKETNSQKFFDSLLGDHSATVNDLLANRDNVSNTRLVGLKDNTIEAADALDMLARLVEQNADYGNLFVDKASLRVNAKGNIYSFAETAGMKDKFLNEFAQTLPGKLLKTRDQIEIKKAPIFNYLGPGEADPILAAVAEGNNSTVVNNRYARILGKTFKILDDNSLEHIQGLDNTYLISGEHGTMNRLLKSITGDIDRKAESKNKIAKWLDFGSNPEPNKLKSSISRFTKFNDPRWARNLVGTFMNADENELLSAVSKIQDNVSPDEKKQSEEYIGRYFDRIKKLDKFFNRTTKQLDRSTINKLFDATKDTPGSSHEMLRLLKMKDEDMINELMNHNPNTFNNPELASLVKRHLKNSDSASRAMSIVSDNSPLGSTKAVRFTEMIRKELAKEAFLSYRNNVSGSNDSLLRLFDVAGIQGQKLKETRYLANWSIFQDAANHYSIGGVQDIEDISKSVLNVQNLFSARVGSKEVDFVNAFRKNIETMTKENASILQHGFQKEDVIPGHSLGRFTTMKKAVSITGAINDATKRKAFLKQFVAGRDDIQDVTTATLFPYFMLHRLVEPLADIGLSFSAKSTGSTIDLAANIMLKRVIPVAGAFTALSYLDFESKNFTGTSLRGAAANTWANIDLANRRFSDIIGRTNRRKENYELNPMRQYLSNNQPYQSYEERKQWYEEGYSPVLKSRLWSFGSDSEFRGGKIEYYEPNYLRQAHSDWHDIGVYGSVNEKWKHSWIPTPRHPLSTLRALADPYWLERKNYWDRPYPVTGKMFEEGTPWGAILNPTVGEIMKPQRRMHQAELGNSMIDVRTLIAQRNKEIKAKANNNSNLVRVDGSGTFTPVTYTPLEDPTGSGSVLSTNTSGGSVSAPYVAGTDYQAMSLTDYEPVHDAIQTRAIAAGAGGTYTNVNHKLSVTDRIQLNADRGGIVSGIIKKAVPLDIISSVNKDIKSRAMMITPEGGKGGVITADAIFKTAGKNSSFLDNDDFKSDLRNISSTKEFLQDAGYSARELGGMYGFLYGQIFPAGKSARLQSADRMNSFTREFWDSSYGGLGGEFMEIARRFIPHENHDVNRINTIKNTMPDWMPERFQYGDPYEKLPKGEMRLPGKGYEDMYKLHSDQYGRYGAYDRMKILADIAPWSREYRVWREIAGKTVKDPNLKTEMDNIKDRVEKQSKQHDFYPYRFLGKKLISTSGVVDTVDNNMFTLVGSDTKYKVAGVKLKNGGVKDYLSPGTNVRLQFGKDEKRQKTINAIVIAQEHNLNKELLNSGKADVSKDESVAGTHARFTSSQIDRAKINELIAHAPIPLIHRKFMRVNTPLESWKDENIYGTPYATWGHPIKGFLTPAVQKAFNMGHIQAAVGTAAWLVSEKVAASGTNKVAKGAAKAAFLLTNPGGFVGYTVGFLPKLSSGKLANTSARIGAAVGLAGYAYTHANNPIFSSTAGALAGMQIAEQFWKGTGSRGALIGAVAGITLTAIKNPSLDPKKMWGPWIPNKVKKKWEIEEYYDRMKYIKYMGLYEKSVRIAKRKEHIDIAHIINKFEYDSKEREKIKKQLLANRQLISNTYAEGDKKREALLLNIDAKLNSLNYPQQVLKAGKYTKAALAYKQAAESTVYGLKENATWSQVLRAVPKYERDYVLEFGKETDPKKRKELLKYMSPYRKKVLQTLWGEKQDKVKSNEKFFANHKLPGTFWAGWQPDVDLDKVEIKTIKNEGMLLSDFGFYESEAETKDAMNAPTVNFDQHQSALELRKNLITSLSGAGLIGVDVNIEPSSEPGIQMVANIARINDYKIKQKINNFAGRIFY